MKNNKAVADFLKKERINVGLTPRDVCKRLKLLGSQYISDVEQGTHLPTVSMACKLAKIYKFDIDVFASLLVAANEPEIRRSLGSNKK